MINKCIVSLAAIVLACHSPAEVVRSMLGARGAIMANPKGIPSGWVELDWIGQNAKRSAYIDTGFVWDDGDWICDADIYPTVSQNENYIISQYSHEQGCYYAFVYMQLTTVRLGYNTNLAAVIPFDDSFFGKFHHWHCEYSDGHQSLEIDNTFTRASSQRWKAGVSQSGMRIIIGGVRTFGSMADGVRFGMVRIQHKGDRTVEFRPVRNAATNEVAMCDILTGDIYHNAGTGAFVAGPDKGAVP